MRFRRLLESGAPVIDRDAPCEHCGYNLRGLHPGRNCPECGRAIPLDLRPLDPLFAGTHSERAWLAHGLTVVATMAAAIVALRLGFAVLWAMTRGALPLWPFIACCVATSLAWIAGVFLATPRRLDALRPRRRALRLIARWSQSLWLPALTCWLLAETKFAATPQADALMFWSAVSGWSAKAGAVALGLLLLQMAEDAELEDATRRLGLGLYVLPVLGAVLALLPHRMWFIMLALMSPLLLAWGWYMLQFALAVWEMRQNVCWGVRAANESHDRDARIAQVRAELDREALAQVRALPPRPHAPPTRPG